jgi:hypothetical protein
MPLPESERLYSDEEIAVLLGEAKSLGFSLEKDSELEHLTVGELDRLVHQVQ